MNFLIPCFLIETLLWARLCNKNREDQAPIPPTPTNPHPSGRLARPLFSWQSRPRGGEARLADTRHAECHMMIYPDNFFPNKFTGKVNFEIFAEQRTRGQQEAFFVISRRDETRIPDTYSQASRWDWEISFNLRDPDEIEIFIFKLKLWDKNKIRNDNTYYENSLECDFFLVPGLIFSKRRAVNFLIFLWMIHLLKLRPASENHFS